MATNAVSEIKQWVHVGLRLTVILTLQSGFILFLKSATLATIIGRPLAGRLHYGPEPMQAAFYLALAIMFFAVAERKPLLNVRMKWRLYVTGILDWMILAIVSLLLAYPPLGLASFFDGMDGTAVVPAVAAAVRYTVIMAMLIPLGWMLLPPGFVRTYRYHLVFGGIALFAYLWLAVLRIALHRQLAFVILSLCSAILRPFVPATISDPEQLMLTTGSFSAVIGPQCLGLDGLFLFLCLWSASWFAATRRRHPDHRRAAGGLLIGMSTLFVLNVVRISAIMHVGARFPQTGVNLFHGGIGAALFLLVFMTLLPCLRSTVHSSDSTPKRHGDEVVLRS